MTMRKWNLEVKHWWPVLKAAAMDWSHDRAPRLGAALAYYTTFSMVPLLIVIIGIIGLVFGQEASQSAIMDQISNLIGPQSAAAIKDMIHRADQPSSGIISTVIATVTLLLGAAGFFGQLKDALNTVWGIEAKEGRGVWGVLKDNFLSFATVLGTAFLLLVSLVVSTGLAAFGKWFGNLLPLPEAVLQIFNMVVSLAVITVLFAFIFKVLPDAHIAWRDVWVGAALTSVLFTIGKFAIGVYLGKSNVGSSYGAAGSLVLVLVWVYYSVQILLYGAEFTQVYANWMGQRIQPTEEANTVNAAKASPVTARPLASHAGEAGRRAPLPRPHRGLTIAASVLASLIIALFVMSSLFSGPLKRYAERQANEQLPEFEITIGKLRLQPFRLGIGLQNVVVRLRATPDPPLAEIPQAKAKIRLLPLFTGKVDVTVHIDHPQLAATSRQMDSVLHTPTKDGSEAETVAWQDRLREIMPVRVSLSLSNGDLRYQPDPNVEPIRVHQVAVTASNVTNRPGEEEQFPSELRVNAHLGDEGEVAIDSRADLLAKPSPRVDGEIKIQHLTLRTLRPLTGPYHVQVRQGAVEMTGHIHYASPRTVVDINDFVLDGAKVDYVHLAQTKNKEAKQAQQGADHVKKADPSVVVKITHGKIVRSDIGFINKDASPDYRVFMSDIDLELHNFSNRPEEGVWARSS
jgi:membrane protein